MRFLVKNLDGKIETVHSLEELIEYLRYRSEIGDDITIINEAKKPRADGDAT